MRPAGAAPLTEAKNLQSVTVEGAASTLLRPIDKETSTDEETGEETVTVTWAASGERRHRQRGHRLSAGGAGGAPSPNAWTTSPQTRPLPCGGRRPATVTILYLNDTGNEGTLTLTFGSENLDQTGYYVRMEGRFHHLPDGHRFGGHHSLWRRMA